MDFLQLCSEDFISLIPGRCLLFKRSVSGGKDICIRASEKQPDLCQCQKNGSLSVLMQTELSFCLLPQLKINTSAALMYYFFFFFT